MVWQVTVTQHSCNCKGKQLIRPRKINNQPILTPHSPDGSFDSRWNSNLSLLHFWIELKFHLNSKLLFWVDLTIQCSKLKLEFHHESNDPSGECIPKLVCIYNGTPRPCKNKACWWYPPESVNWRFSIESTFPCLRVVLSQFGRVYKWKSLHSAFWSLCLDELRIINSLTSCH